VYAIDKSGIVLAIAMSIVVELFVETRDKSVGTVCIALTVQSQLP